MRRIDPTQFAIARRGTSRQINRQIALTLISSHQPISRADLARRMNLRRGAVGLLIEELLHAGHIVEGAAVTAPRGRRPTQLFINTAPRFSVAVDVRASATYLMLADFVGAPRSDIVTLPTPREPRQFTVRLARRIRSLIGQAPSGRCEGVGIAVAGMVDHLTGRVLHAPTLGWRDVDLRGRLARAVGLPVHIENAGRACALAHLWEARAEAAATRDLVFVSVSDGVGVGVVINGELVRGRNSIAGEFAHMPLSIDGPRCSCGSTGCWETYISNPATMRRYGREVSIDTVIARAGSGDRRAVAALLETARYLGIGCATIVNTINPSSIVIGGEITTAWDLIAGVVRRGLAERALVPSAAATTVITVSSGDLPRLRGAAMLVAAPVFAAPVVA